MLIAGLVIAAGQAGSETSDNVALPDTGSQNASDLLGDRFPSQAYGEDRWHGATPNRFMTHLAMLDVDDEGNSATWGAHDDEYQAAPA